MCKCLRNGYTYPVADVAVVMLIIVMLIQVVPVVKQHAAALARGMARALNFVLLESLRGYEILVAFVADVMHIRVVLVLL